jgi:SynChlorMet cassette protein ScmD
MTNVEMPTINPIAVLREEFDDWAVLFNPDTAEALGTNPVGVFIWKKMDGTKSIAEIAAAVKEHFGNVPESVESEVMAYIYQLTLRGFTRKDAEGR